MIANALTDAPDWSRKIYSAEDPLVSGATEESRTGIHTSLEQYDADLAYPAQKCGGNRFLQYGFGPYIYLSYIVDGRIPRSKLDMANY